eukprot:1156266-Pelagomonas_calceolata.AAC.4
MYGSRPPDATAAMYAAIWLLMQPAAKVIPVRQCSAPLQVGFDLCCVVFEGSLNLLVVVCIAAVDEVDVLVFPVRATPAETAFLLPPVLNKNTQFWQGVTDAQQGSV